MCSGSRPSSSQAPRTSSRTGTLLLQQVNAEAAVPRQLVERGGHAAAGRVAHPAEARPRGRRHGLDQREHRPRVGAEIGLEVELAARQEDGDAVIADRAREQDPVAGPDATGRRAPAPGSGRPMPVVVMYMPVGLAVLDHLGVAADDRRPRRARAARPMARTSASSTCDGQAGLEHEARDQRDRPRAADREVVDRAVDRQLADRAAGKTQRRDHEAVGGDGEAGAVHVDRGGIAERLRCASRGIEQQRQRTGPRPAGGWPCRRRRAPSRSAGRGTGRGGAALSIGPSGVRTAPRRWPPLVLRGARSCSRRRTSLPTRPSARRPGAPACTPGRTACTAPA